MDLLSHLHHHRSSLGLLDQLDLFDPDLVLVLHKLRSVVDAEQLAKITFQRFYDASGLRQQSIATHRVICSRQWMRNFRRLCLVKSHPAYKSSVLLVASVSSRLKSNHSTRYSIDE